MLKERIEHYFQQYPQLKVLFFFDEAKEQEEEFDAMHLEGIRKLKYEGRNFYYKVMFRNDWANDKVFLYFQQKEPLTQAAYRNFPLLDLLVANKVLYLDNVADFMNQYQLAPNQRTLAKRFINELKYGTVQKVLEPVLTRARFQEADVVKGLISHFLQFSRPERWEILLARLTCLNLPTLAEERDRFLKKVNDNHLQGFFVSPIRDYFGITIMELDEAVIGELHNRLKYNMIMHPLDVKSDDWYKKSKITDGVVLSMLTSMSDNALMHPKIGTDFLKLLESNECQVKERVLLQIYGPEAGYGYMPQAMRWRILETGLPLLDAKPQQALDIFERLALQQGNQPQLVSTLRFLIYLAHIVRQLNGMASFIFDTPDEYIGQYTRELYLIDMHYRQAVVSFREIDTTALPDSLQLDPMKELLEAKYEMYLERLNREWLKCLAEAGFDYRHIAVPKQYEFIQREVLPYDQKIVVVVSDALRYEAAISLLGEMHGDGKNEAVVRCQLASVPSTTPFGMSNLLANGTMAFDNEELTINGISTEGLVNRQKIAALIQPEAKVVGYAEIAGNTQAVNREIFKAPLVFIYHDCIDAVGDKRSSERNAFQAVSDAVGELSSLVKKLHSSYNVSRVLVTSDHGFLYNDRTIQESDKEPLVEDGALQTHNRYVLVRNNKKQALGYKIPLRAVTLVDSDLYVLVPQSVNRYKKQGVGHQFVHGGASLQELVVPILESTRKRTDVVRKVNPVLVSKNLRVVSNILRIQLLQEQKVSNLEKERAVVVGLYRDMELVSNQVLLHLQSTSELPSERSYGCELMLRGNIGHVGLLKLKVYDRDDDLNPLIVEDVINNTLIEPDF